MALLQDLIRQINDPTLRDRILQETDKLMKQKKFGLVFEEHLPECTPLHDVPIRVGSKVALKTGYVSDIYMVIKLDGNEALCDRRETHEKVTFQLDVQQVKQFKLATQIFDAFGETVDNYSVHDMFTTTDTDIERQFQIADVKLGREGIGMAYGNKYGDLSDLTAFKIDVILFVADENCMNRLHTYAENRFHGLNDDYRRYIATINSEKIRRDYDSIVSDGDVVSKHNFRLPETILVPHEAGGKEYRDHLFVSDTTGTAKLKLNGWEADLIAEEEKRQDFVCWIRNPSRASWALCIPYEINGEIKPTYPDFIIVREDERLGYVIDILEPHSADFKDNLGKAKGFAEYARQNPGVGRIQLIRMGKDAAGRNQFRRLDMYKTAIREKVSCAINTDELDHIFDTDGVIE